MFHGRYLQKTVDIAMGTNCAPILVDLFLYWRPLHTGTSQENFFKCSNMPAAPAYCVYITSQLIRDSRTFGSYNDFRDRGSILTRKILGRRNYIIHLLAISELWEYFLWRCVQNSAKQRKVGRLHVIMNIRRSMTVQ